MLVVNIGDLAVDFYPECTLVDARKLPITFRYYARVLLSSCPRQWSMFVDVMYHTDKAYSVYRIIAYNYVGCVVSHQFSSESS